MPPPDTIAHTLTDVQVREEAEQSIIVFDHLIYGSINVFAYGNLDMTFLLNGEPITASCQGSGYRSIGYLAFNQVVIKGQFSFCSATHYSLDHYHLTEAQAMQRVALRTLSTVAQHQVFHHLNRAPYAVASSLLAFIAADSHWGGSGAAIEESLLVLLNQHDASPSEQCYLALCLKAYTQRVNHTFILKNKELIGAAFWRHLLFIDQKALLYLPGHELDDDSLIALQALSFRALESYSYLFDQLHDRDLQLKSRTLLYKKEALTPFPLSPIAAAQVILAGMDQHHHAEFFLKERLLSDLKIEHLYPIGQALLAINARALLTSYLECFDLNDDPASLYLAAWLILSVE